MSLKMAFRGLLCGLVSDGGGFAVAPATGGNCR